MLGRVFAGPIPGQIVGYYTTYQYPELTYRQTFLVACILMNAFILILGWHGVVPVASCQARGPSHTLQLEQIQRGLARLYAHGAAYRHAVCLSSLQRDGSRQTR